MSNMIKLMTSKAIKLQLYMSVHFQFPTQFSHVCAEKVEVFYVVACLQFKFFWPIQVLTLPLFLRALALHEKSLSNW